ncbi:MAG: L-threonylcarbamoyladenylate synthase [Mycoplasmataceae bacterium]|nr:L-threonylcarbamoyladenylate synthase [Mycoplasmataceae bacterium]
MRIYDWNELEQIAFELKNNKAAIVETDTVLGIVSLNPNLIYTIKKRNRNKKLIYFIDSISEIKNLTKIEKYILKKYWPGGLTIIKNGIGYRMPNHPKLLKLINLTNGMYSSSANLSKHQPIYDAQEAITVFKKQNFNLVIVKGQQQSEAPSTIIDFDKIKVLRIGVIDPNPIINILSNNRST